ncbi:MAG: DUF2207 domain-containing protein [Candidatus Dependentiae bacterium]|nr:DUF2207 domain-containing protein [Candidatus Dependentiae bacterium]
MNSIVKNRGDQVTHFHADITINSDALVEVVETITVWSEGKQVKRGIVRELSTQDQDRYSNKDSISFSIKKVLKDGKDVTHKFVSTRYGKDIEIGDNALIGNGEHVYTISYVARGVIGFCVNQDELYWNVTGTAWQLPIVNASATVFLPRSVPADSVHIDAYTGPLGARDKKYISYKKDDGSLFFSTTGLLAPYEGLTIFITWPKGYANEPIQVINQERKGWSFDEWHTIKKNSFFYINKYWVLVGGLIGLLALLVYVSILIEGWQSHQRYSGLRTGYSGGSLSSGSRSTASSSRSSGGGYGGRGGRGR